MPFRQLPLALALSLIASVPAAAQTVASPGGGCPAMASGEHVLPPAKFDDGPLLSPAVLVADFDAWISGMRGLNPDLSIRANVEELNREAARIRAELTKPMSLREAWLRFAKLNPYLRDGHAGVQMPDYRGALEAHLKAGGHVVPLEVRFAGDGSVRVFTVASGVNGGVKPGDRVVAINDHRVEEMIPAMMSLSIGDTPAYQRAFLERRFAMLYFYLYGDTGQYDVAVQSGAGRCPNLVRTEGGTTLPEALQSQPGADELFGWRILPDNIGYLRIDGFDPGLGSALDKVTRTAFAAFKEHNVAALIVDVRENGGGDDPLWEQDLADHFTTKPYAQLSHYVTRVTRDNAGPGDVIGTIQSADFTKRFTPPPLDPVRFDGPVYILDGPYSYSAAIQFIVASQDFHLAKIAGEETAALSCQTGQIKRIDLPWTGLAAATPITAYTRPSGESCKRGVIPDVPIAIDEVEPDKTLNALVTWIDSHR